MSLHFHNFLWIPIIPILKYNSIYFLSLQTLKTDPHNNRWIDPAKAILRVLVCICVFILLICECHTHSIDAYNGLGTEKHFQMSLGYTFDISMMTNNMRGLSNSNASIICYINQENNLNILYDIICIYLYFSSNLVLPSNTEHFSLMFINSQ